ncbi:MAG: DUF58 domain-containing protein [Oscillospiraceae bacterium]
MIFLYLILLIISILFYILYEGLISLLIFLFTAIFPIVAVSLNLYAAKRITAKIEIKSRSAAAGENIPLEITLSNPSVIPVLSAEIIIDCAVSSSSSHDHIKINTPIFPNNTQTLSLSFSSAHFGAAECTIKRIKIYDMLRLTSPKLKEKKYLAKSASVMIMPPPLVLQNTVNGLSNSAADSDDFSDAKPGDDPSQIFSLREYNDGDKISRIHWKLSAQQDKLMVKDYSFPLNDAFLIIADAYSSHPDPEARAKLYDAVIQVVVSLSNLFAENEIRHKIASYSCKTERLEEYSVFDSDSFFDGCSGLLMCGTPRSANEALKALSASAAAPRQFSHILLVCSEADDSAVSMLEACELADKNTILICSCGDAPARLDINVNSDTEIINVRSDMIERSLMDLEL